MNGILYCATTLTHLQQARVSVSSLKKYMPEISCTICTSLPEKNNLWDNLISIKQSELDENLFALDKLKSLLLSPYENTLFLDTDTYILDDISDVFTILSKFDLALCHGHDRNLRLKKQTGEISHAGIHRTIVSKNIPGSFSPLQSGVLAYTNSKKITNLFKNLIDLYQKKNYFDDQAILRQLLWDEGIHFYILPPEYNFNSVSFLKHAAVNSFLEYTPKIFHYTKNKKQDIPRLVKKYHKQKYYLIKLKNRILNGAR